MGTTGIQHTLWLISAALLGGSLCQIVTDSPSLTQLNLNSANGSFIDQVCSTWGNYHWKTFDGHFYQLPSTCNHVVAMQCKTSYSTFNIQMWRTLVNGVPSISKIILVLDGSLVELSKGSVAVNQQTVLILPHFLFGISIQGTPS
ncbi:mucin-6-like [Takifugu rubripes]|uniref:mucin-6-like n=1 Tax=Takifugu rubripes TaxID=31033 RepID=UPI001145F133|nr:mucin-6-like [Takifugu rubripes]